MKQINSIKSVSVWFILKNPKKNLISQDAVKISELVTWLPLKDHIPHPNILERKKLNMKVKVGIKLVLVNYGPKSQLLSNAFLLQFS